MYKQEWMDFKENNLLVQLLTALILLQWPICVIQGGPNKNETAYFP